MTYEAAMSHVKAGTSVKRSSWTNQTLTRVTNADGTYTIQNNKTVTVRAPYLADQDDMFADDWVDA